MKRLIFAITVIGALFIASVNVTAATPKKRSSAKTTQTVPMKLNAEGYADMTGHSYSCKGVEAVTFKFVFKPKHAMTLSMYNEGKYVGTSYGFWEQKGDQVIIYDENQVYLMSLNNKSEKGERLDGYSRFNDEFNLVLIK